MSTSTLITGKPFSVANILKALASRPLGGRSRPSLKLPTICLSLRPATPSQSAGRSRPRFTPRTARRRA